MKESLREWVPDIVLIALTAAVIFGALWIVIVGDENRVESLVRQKVDEVLDAGYSCMVNNPMPVQFRYWFCMNKAKIEVFAKGEEK